MLKRGDIVGRKSYGKDILFFVDKIIKLNSGQQLVLLKGVTSRIEADALANDLEVIDSRTVYNNVNKLEDILDKRIETYKLKQRETRRNNIYTGKILHLDGDKKYSEKSARYYQKMGLNAIVKNISESKQPQLVKQFLEKYKPDILIVTGHDAMLKNGTNYNSIYNYRNSKYFIETVKEARTWQKSSDKLVIFAGACQSFFEAIMNAGADFASSPARILIDFIDPLIVAEKIALTDSYRFVSIYEIIKEIREGEKGVGGIGAKGKKRIVKNL